MEAYTIQETQRVAICTFSVKCHPANVLFDTRTTHYFVTASWVETHNIPVAPMFPPMRVSSVGWKTQTDRLCPNARVEFRGKEFSANLIVMGTRDVDIDVILMMHWLTKYQVVLSYDKRIVRLVSSSSEEVVAYPLLLARGPYPSDPPSSFATAAPMACARAVRPTPTTARPAYVARALGKDPTHSLSSPLPHIHAPPPLHSPSRSAASPPSLRHSVVATRILPSLWPR